MRENTSPREGLLASIGGGAITGKYSIAIWIGRFCRPALRGSSLACRAKRALVAGHVGRAGCSESNPIATLQFEYFTRLLWGGDLQAEFFQDATDLRHLLGIRLCQRAAADIQAVL
jgi:hypothetical protein